MQAVKIEFEASVIEKSKGILTKKVKLENGEFVKDGSGCRMASGTVTKVKTTLEKLQAGLPRFKPNQALVHGICNHDKAQIVSKRKIEQQSKIKRVLPVITRTLKYFSYPSGPAIMLLDSDAPRPGSVYLEEKAGINYTPEILMQAIGDTFPAFKNIAYLAINSTSSCIKNSETDEVVRGPGTGAHVYVLVDKGEEIPRILELIGQRLILAGYGRLEISLSGALLTRTICDLSVGSPERLDFVAGAVCEEPLVQELPKPVLVPGEMLITEDIEQLTPPEALRYKEIMEELAEKAKGPQAAVKESYIKTESEKIQKTTGVSAEQAIEIIKSRQNKILMPEDLLLFAHKKDPVMVESVLLNADDYDKRTLADPLEPSYDGNSTTKAIFYANDGKPTIHSFAHGSVNYKFHGIEYAKKKEESGENDSLISLAVENLNREFALCAIGSEARVIREYKSSVDGKIYVSFLSQATFNTILANKKLFLEGHKKPIPLSKLWMESPERREYLRGLIFDPSREHEEGCYNLYRGMGVNPRRGDWSLMRRHMLEVICDGDQEIFDYLMAWCARIVQDPGSPRPGVSFVIQGGKGTGKGIFVNWFGKIFGDHYTRIDDPQRLFGRFNFAMSNVILLFADEAFFAGDKRSEGKLKGLITEPMAWFEDKGVSAVELKNHINIIMASNENWVVPVTADERRFVVTRASDSRAGDFKYFKKLDESMENGGIEAMCFDLMQYKYDPEMLRHAPVTEYLQEQNSYNFSSVEDFWAHCLSSGCIFPKDEYGKFIEDKEWEEGEDLSKEKIYNLYTDYCTGHKNLYPVSLMNFWRETYGKNGCFGRRSKRFIKRIRIGLGDTQKRFFCPESRIDMIKYFEEDGKRISDIDDEIEEEAEVFLGDTGITRDDL